MLTNLVRKYAHWLFPPQAHTTTLAPHYQPRLYQDTVCLLPYHQAAVQHAIKANKYHADPAAAHTLAAVLDQHLAGLAGPVTIVPTPQSYRRWRERGFDHLAAITRHCTTPALTTVPALQKTIHTDHQTRVDRATRRQQQAGTFTCRPAAATLTGTVILLDDVITTGATMQAARAALAPHLPRDTKLICLALAH